MSTLHVATIVNNEGTHNNKLEADDSGVNQVELIQLALGDRSLPKPKP